MELKDGKGYSYESSWELQNEDIHLLKYNSCRIVLQALYVSEIAASLFSPLEKNEINFIIDEVRKVGGSDGVTGIQIFFKPNEKAIADLEKTNSIHLMVVVQNLHPPVLLWVE